MPEQQSPFIGGKPAATVDANGNIQLLGVAATPGQLQDYIDRQSAKLTSNAATLQQVPGLADNPSMKRLLGDMQANVDNAKKVLVQYTKLKPKAAPTQQAAPAPTQQAAPAPTQQAAPAAAPSNSAQPLGDMF
jgi:hypothetical protein